MNEKENFGLTHSIRRRRRWKFLILEPTKNEKLSRDRDAAFDAFSAADRNYFPDPAIRVLRNLHLKIV